MSEPEFEQNLRLPGWSMTRAATPRALSGPSNVIICSWLSASKWEMKIQSLTWSKSIPFLEIIRWGPFLKSLLSRILHSNPRISASNVYKYCALMNLNRNATTKMYSWKRGCVSYPLCFQKKLYRKKQKLELNRQQEGARMRSLGHTVGTGEQRLWCHNLNSWLSIKQLHCGLFCFLIFQLPGNNSFRNQIKGQELKISTTVHNKLNSK